MQKKDYQKLRECPFCGGEAMLNAGNDRNYSLVKCRDCGAESGMVKVSAEYCADERAIYAWNRRTENKEV